MEITLTHGPFDEYGGYQQYQELEVITEEGKSSISTCNLSECPEDASLERDIISCEIILGLLRDAYKAGLRGEPLIIDIVEED